MSHHARTEQIEDATWRRALELSEQLVALADDRLREELVIYSSTGQDVWFDDGMALTQVVAAALCQGARCSGVGLGEVALCAVSDAVTTAPWDLFDGVPVSTPVHWHGSGYAPQPGFAGYRMGLRLRRILWCPNAHHDGGCERVANRVSTPSSGPMMWQAAVLDGKIMTVAEDGVHTVTCERCGAGAVWMLAQPAGAGEWAWRLCRCGHTEPTVVSTGPDIRALAWKTLTTRQLEQMARERGFGRVDPWFVPEGFRRSADPTTHLAYALPLMSRGGNALWRSAIRAGATALASTGGHREFPRDLDGGVNGCRLLAAASLAGLALYAMSQDTGLPPEQINLTRVLAGGAGAVHAQIAPHVPDAAALGELSEDFEWSMREHAWPSGTYRYSGQEMRTDPASIAWATLCARGYAPEKPALFPSDHAVSYGLAYDTLAALTAH
jgi:hypothetical protein